MGAPRERNELRKATGNKLTTCSHRPGRKVTLLIQGLFVPGVTPSSKSRKYHTKLLDLGGVSLVLIMEMGAEEPRVSSLLKKKINKVRLGRDNFKSKPEI